MGIDHWNRIGVYSVPKTNDTANEDRWAVSSDGHSIAISDGASISFDSAKWAELICRRFIENVTLTPAWLQSAVEEYSAAYDRDVMLWMQQGAFDRGSFATLLGVTISKNYESINVAAIGDSVFFLADGDTRVCVIPKMLPDDFDRSPQLLSTNAAENAFATDEYFAGICQKISLTNLRDPRCLMMTDALARWVLEGVGEERLDQLIAIQSSEEFFQLVISERDQGRLKRDDTTLIVIG